MSERKAYSIDNLPKYIEDAILNAETPKDLRLESTDNINAAVDLFRTELPHWTSYTIEISTRRRMTRFNIEIARLADTDDGEIIFSKGGENIEEVMKSLIIEAKVYDLNRKKFNMYRKPWIIHTSIGRHGNRRFISYHGDIPQHTHEFLRYTSDIDSIDSAVRFSSRLDAETFIESVAKRLDNYNFIPIEVKVSIAY